MKTFLLVEKQSGGCDYTIGCGIRVSRIYAENMDEAIKQVGGNLTLDDIKQDDENEDDAHDRIMDHFNLPSRFHLMNEYSIDSAILYEVSDIKNLEEPLTKSKSSIKEYMDSIATSKKEKDELRLLKLLKEKYET